MKSSFSNIVNNRFDRNFGGTLKGVADPYISGYHFIWFPELPAQLANAVGVTDNANLASLTNIQKVLSAACQSVTPPGGTLNKTEFPALGGTKWGAPTNVDYGNTLTVKFLEYSSLPILSIMHGWVRMIRDYRTGVSVLGSGRDYSKQEYSASMYYWTTKPDGFTVEYYACYVGMFPTKDPQDLYAGDIATYDKLEVDVEFHLDKAYHENWVYNKCSNLAKSFWQEGSGYHGLGYTVGSVEGTSGG